MAAMTERKVGFADTYGTTAAVEVDDDGEIRTELTVGLCGGTGYPTAAAARQYAALLLDAAEKSDEIRAEAGEGE
jgi:hypothetical protein